MIYKWYKTINGQDAIMAIGNGKQASFICDPDNTDYQAYLKWVEAGNTPQAADAATEPADEQGA
jgi:hypothetical protein